MAMAVSFFFSHAVQLTANWHGCSLLLHLLLIPLPGLQPSPPAPQLHNTTSRCRKHRRACLINMEQLPKEEEGFGKHGANGRLLCIRICTGGGVCLCPMGRENAEKVLSYSWCVSQGETSRPDTANGARWHLITKANTKRPHSQQLAFWRDGWGNPGGPWHQQKSPPYIHIQLITSSHIRLKLGSKIGNMKTHFSTLQSSLIILQDWILKNASINHFFIAS